MRIAVVGAGISGNLVARMLASRHDVQLFEAGHYAGGHSNTVDVQMDGQQFSVDTGFMVFNEKTYPNFCRLLEVLGVEARDSDMSFSVRCSRTGLEYQGSSLNGLFAQRRNLIRPKFYGMLRDVLRFNRQSLEVLDSSESYSLGDYLKQRSYGDEFINHYLLPMSAAIWSCRPAQMLDFPARFLVAFFRNHGLLQICNRPQWRTIPGGARTYVERLLAPIREQVRLNCPVESVVRYQDQVVVKPCGAEPESFDQVVFATHADQTLRMLADCDEMEREVLSVFPYQENQALLHTDPSSLPRRRRAWASWNYHLPADAGGPVSVTYDLSRLQNHDSPRPILLTLNDPASVDPAQVLRKFVYHHPAYNRHSMAAQRRQLQINGRRRSFFCGAYWGYGFHEDGVNSALAVGSHFGIGLDACKVASTRATLPTTALAR